MHFFSTYQKVAYSSEFSLLRPKEGTLRKVGKLALASCSAIYGIFSRNTYIVCSLENPTFRVLLKKYKDRYTYYMGSLVYYQNC